MSETSIRKHEFSIRKIIDARPAEIFDAWLDPKLLGCWLAPSETMECDIVALDARESGKFHFEMKDDEGETYTMLGAYLRIRRPRELVLSFHWISEPEHVMQVTVKFEPQGSSTELILRHENLPSAESRDGHQQGWTGSLARLLQLYDLSNEVGR